MYRVRVSIVKFISTQVFPKDLRNYTNIFAMFQDKASHLSLSLVDYADYYEEILFAQGAQSVSRSVTHAQEDQKIQLAALFREKIDLNILQDLMPLARIALSEMGDEQWKDIWKDYAEPFHIKDFLSIFPEHWEDKSTDKAWKIVLDASESFGDGSHPTTRMSLKLMYEVMHGEKGSSLSNLRMLDVGCGSGILSIFAAKLGLREITAFDNDAHAIHQAQKNASINKIDEIDGINFLHADLENASKLISGTFHLITANLLTKLLQENFSSLLSFAANDSYMILSGISQVWRQQMRDLFALYPRLVVLQELEEEEWLAFLLRIDGRSSI